MDKMNKLVERIDQTERLLGKAQASVHIIGKYAHQAQHVGKKANSITAPVRMLGKQLGLWWFWLRFEVW